jgi:DNA-binding FrmR family transcriptional regulator
MGERMTEYGSHPSHGGQVPMLNRAIEQLEGIKRMISEGQDTQSRQISELISLLKKYE